MTLSKLIYISLAVITLSMSPSAYSERKYYTNKINVTDLKVHT